MTYKAETQPQDKFGYRCFQLDNNVDCTFYMRIPAHTETTLFQCLAKSRKTGTEKEFQVGTEGYNAGYISINVPADSEENKGYTFRVLTRETIDDPWVSVGYGIMYDQSM